VLCATGEDTIQKLLAVANRKVPNVKPECGFVGRRKRMMLLLGSFHLYLLAQEF